MNDLRLSKVPVAELPVEGLVPEGPGEDPGATYRVSLVDLYVHAVLRAYALGYEGRARLAERMKGDSALKVPRGGLIE